MATNHTDHYQLHLWEPGDSFLREEFNENTGRIDNALAGKAEAAAVAALAEEVDVLRGRSRFTVLRSVLTTEGSSQIDIDVSDLDLGAWFRIYVVTDLVGWGTALLRFNDDSANSHYFYAGTGSSYSGGIVTVSVSTSDYNSVVQLTPAWNSAHFVYAINFEGGIVHGQNTHQRYADLHTLNLALLSGENYFSAGSKIQIVGVK